MTVGSFSHFASEVVQSLRIPDPFRNERRKDECADDLPNSTVPGSAIVPMFELQRKLHILSKMPPLVLTLWPKVG